MKEKLSINDIAMLANVSKSTVSRYLNNGYVKEATKVKIATVIEENNYEPNRFARLKAKDSQIIGVIAPCLDSSVTSQVLMEIDATLREKNYLSLFINTNHNTTEELRSMENLGRMNVDGIILNATQVSQQHAQIAKKLGIPIIFVAQTCEEGISIVNEDYEAGRAMGEYAIKMNQKKILCISVSPQDVAVGLLRRQGMVDVLSEHPLEVDVIESDFSLEHSYEVVNNYLETHIPDMIICSTTKQLLATYKVLHDKGLKIPEDVSVVGFGGQEVSDILVPKATTIQFSPKTTGKLSAKAMLALLNGEDVAKIQTVPYQFYEKESVKKRK